MKAFVPLLILLSTIAASAQPLDGADAADFARILHRAGIPANWDVGFLSAQNLHCAGVRFVDHCRAAEADAQPAAKPVAILPSDIEELSHLLKKAGFENQPGRGSEAGEVVVDVHRVDCNFQIRRPDQFCFFSQ